LGLGDINDAAQDAHDRFLRQLFVRLSFLRLLAGWLCWSADTAHHHSTIQHCFEITLQGAACGR
jgi:hypothetical protein